MAEVKTQKDKDIETVIDSLNGTAQGIHRVLESHDLEYLEDDDEFLSELDQNIFECGCCGWWCEQGEAEEHEDFYNDICGDCP